MDKSTRNHLSALDAFIKAQVEANKPMQPDEFTIYDYIKKMKDQGVNLNFNKAVRTMNDLMDTGVITARKGVQNGKQCNIYRFV